MINESILESRKYNQRNKMLNVIRTGEDVSRNDLKKITSYSMTTVLSTVDEMIKDRLVIEEECSDARVGRRPIWLRLNPGGGYFVGLEFNRIQMHCVVLDFAGKLIYDNTYTLEKDDTKAKFVIEMIKTMIHKALDFLKDKNGTVFGIGLGVPGYNDKSRGIAISYSHVEGWENIPIKRIVEEEFHIPCYMCNNVDVMIYAYKWLIYQGKCEDMLFISIRTGVHLIPIINNQAVSSRYGFPGELGHVKVAGGSRLCACGRYGCLNSEISDVAIINRISEGIRVGRFKEIADAVNNDTDQVTMALFLDSVRKGHEDSVRLLEQIKIFLGDTLSMLVNIFAPGKIVLYGALAELGELLLDDLHEYVFRNVVKENTKDLQIVASEFGRNLGALGAAALVLQEAFKFVDERI